jgi:hypothetical protein
MSLACLSSDPDALCHLGTTALCLISLQENVAQGVGMRLFLSFVEFHLKVQPKKHNQIYFDSV